MNYQEAKESLGYASIHYTEWQYETSDYKLGRVRNYPNGKFTASYFDGDNWVQVEVDGEEEWNIHDDAYVALATKLASVKI